MRRCRTPRLSARFGGPALELRTAAYRIHKGDKKQALPQAIPTSRSVDARDPP